LFRYLLIYGICFYQILVDYLGSLINRNSLLSDKLDSFTFSSYIVTFFILQSRNRIRNISFLCNSEFSLRVPNISTVLLQSHILTSSLEIFFIIYSYLCPVLPICNGFWNVWMILTESDCVLIEPFLLVLLHVTFHHRIFWTSL
jgi:hypothetical protein